MASRLTWAALGMASAALALGVGEVVAGMLNATSPVSAVGALVISLQPPGAKDLMVSLFGTNDKLALEVATFVGGVLVGALLGLVARRDVRLGIAGFVVAGAVGLVLLLQDPLEDVLAAALTIGAAILAGGALLSWLAQMITPRPVSRVTDAAGPASPAPAGAATVAGPAGTAPAGTSMPRRGFLVIAGTFVAIGAFLSVVGRLLGSSAALPPSAAAVAIPGPLTTAPPIPAGADFSLAGLSPIVIPNDDFYLIDTRLTTPQLDVTKWSLLIHGMVDHEVTLSYADLLAMPLVEQYVTIACVSNEVGGRLVGNAKWTGVNLNSVLAKAGVQPGATQLVGRSFDGWTAGFPTAHLAGAGKDAIIAVQMNGVPLPPRHGYPARLMVPGLYGYVSATKWITEIELTTMEAFDAYWIRLGWAKQGPILTQSRIELPRSGQQASGSDMTVAGVAWAPTRGVSKVEVQLDDEDAWRPTELSVPMNDYSWVQWRTTLSVAAGSHTLRVRATDGSGAVQDPGPTPPAPDGARGYHQITVVAS